MLTGKPAPELDRMGVSNELVDYNGITRRGLERALVNSTQASRLLSRLEPPTAELRSIRDEWLLGARLSEHACRRALWHNHRIGDAKKLRREIKRLAAEFETPCRA